MQATEALCHLSVTDIKKPFCNVWFFCKNEVCVNCGTLNATTPIWLLIDWKGFQSCLFVFVNYNVSIRKCTKIQGLCKGIISPTALKHMLFLISLCKLQTFLIFFYEIVFFHETLFNKCMHFHYRILKNKQGNYR